MTLPELRIRERPKRRASVVLLMIAAWINGAAAMFVFLERVLS